MPTDPSVTVVVVTRDRRHDLRRCLDRLAALPESPPVLVVDNASGDGTADLVRRHPGRPGVVVLPRNLGAAGRNVGARLAGTEFVAFCDDDSWWEPGALDRAVRTLAARPDVAAVAARVLVGAEGSLDPVSAAMGGHPAADRSQEEPPDIYGFLACGVVVRRRAFLAAGGFEPLLVIGAEEEALTWRLRAAGWRLVYDPRVVARHDPSPSRDPRARRRHHVRNELLVAWMHLPGTEAVGRARRALAGPAPDRLGLLDALALYPAARRRRRIPPGPWRPHPRWTWLVASGRTGARPTSG